MFTVDSDRYPTSVLLIARIFNTTMSDHNHKLFAEETAGSEEKRSANHTPPEKKNSEEVKGKTAAVEADDPILASSKAVSGSKISAGMVQEILKANPSLAAETQGTDPKMIQEMLGQLTLEEMLTGMVCSCSLGYIGDGLGNANVLLDIQAPGGKNKKDMASYKFWATQPVTRFGMLLLNCYRDRSQGLTANELKMNLKLSDQMVQSENKNSRTSRNRVPNWLTGLNGILWT